MRELPADIAAFQLSLDAQEHGADVRRSPVSGVQPIAAIDARGESLGFVMDVARQSGFCFDLNAIHRREGYLPSPSQLACALGHKRIWRLVLELELPYALVLEDDAVKAADLPLEALLPILRSSNPVVVQLSCRGEIFSEGRATLRDTRPMVVKLRYPPRSTAAYLINQAAAHLASDSSIDGLADWPGFATHVDFFACLPWPFKENLSPSTIQIGIINKEAHVNPKGFHAFPFTYDHAYRVFLPRVDAWFWRQRGRPTIDPGQHIWQPSVPWPLIRAIRHLARRSRVSRSGQTNPPSFESQQTKHPS